MKTLTLTTLTLVAFAVSLSLPAQSETFGAQLVGIVSVPQFQRAIVACPQARPEWHRLVILAEGQREGDTAVEHIDAAKGNARVRLFGTNVVTLSLENRTNLPSSGIALESVNLIRMLLLYGELKNRTVLLHPDLPATALSLNSPAKDEVEAAAVIEKAVEKLGIETILDGKKFVLVVPQSKATAVKPRLPTPTLLAATLPLSKFDAEVLPAGAMYLCNADGAQVFAIWAELLGRQSDRSQRYPGPFGHGGFVLRTQTPVTRGEAVYALETLFAWHDIKAVPVGTNLLKAVRLSE